MAQFTAEFNHSLNRKKVVTFSNKGLVKGIMCRIENGVRKAYYTEHPHYYRHGTYGEAITTLERLTGKKLHVRPGRKRKAK